jgi:CubicO group peptidase (beta-lactamase class C family)
MTTAQFANEYLFSPLGINHVQWGDEEDQGAISSGLSLYMTPRDMAKIGQLVLNKGKWNGEQVVSAKWVEDATTPKTSITGIAYGYLWWNIPFMVKGKTYTAKTATGNGGQYIMVFPELDMVAVFTGGAYNSNEDKLPFGITMDVLLPMFLPQE